jgi:lipid II:glycine glycyltransferase (peptidoglycan interpeptide bridge formation enzyme)
MSINLSQCASAADWNALAASLPQTHILQSWEWGDFKCRYGWSARRFVWKNEEAPWALAAAQVLTRSEWGLRILYVPKGPLLNWDDDALRGQVLTDLQNLARREHAIFIKIDPDLPLPAGAGELSVDTPSLEVFGPERLPAGRWRFSRDQIQFRNTVLLDLRRSESEILAAMKQKTRYNVRLAEKRGVRVRLGGRADLDLLYAMYAQTSLRDGFAIRSAEYYQDAWGSFMEAGLAQPLIAEAEGEALSAIILFKFARSAWYMYGMSREIQRDKMPNHLLQWEAMRWARAQGCETYDFWGAPNEFVETDPMWGVWKFKEGFGGQVVKCVGAWDHAPIPWVYHLYSAILPKILRAMRWRGKKSTQDSVNNRYISVT